MNKVIITGRIKSEINLNTTKTAGTPAVGITVAVEPQQYFKERGTEEFLFSVSAYGNNAKYIYENFRRGDEILVEGYLRPHTHEIVNNNARTEYKTVEINVDRVEYLNKPAREETETAGQPAPAPVIDRPVFTDEMTAEAERKASAAEETDKHITVDETDDDDDLSAPVEIKREPDPFDDDDDDGGTDGDEYDEGGDTELPL